MSPAPLALMFALTCLLVVQLVAPRPSAPSASPMARASGPQPVTLASSPLAPVITARPIFTPTRSLAGGGPATSSEPQLTDYTLVGVVRTPRFSSATLSGPGGKLVDMRPGQNLLGWRLEAVSGDSAVFALNGERRRLTANGAPAAPGNLIR